MNIKTFLKSVAFPLIVSTLLVILIFNWGVRVGTASQQDQYNPVVEECVQENAALQNSISSMTAESCKLVPTDSCASVCGAIAQATDGSLSADGGFRTDDAMSCVCFFTINM